MTGSGMSGTMRCASAVGDAGGAGGAERLTRKQSACAIDVSTMVMPVVVVVLLLVMERAWGQLATWQ